jgi:hypothetical protein
MSDEPIEERWQMLSKLYLTMRKTFQYDYRHAALLARNLRIQLAKQLGCELSSICVFDYDETTYAYEPAENTFEAVSMNTITFGFWVSA